MGKNQEMMRKAREGGCCLLSVMDRSPNLDSPFINLYSQTVL